jgi:hypothetical protein
MKTHRIKVVIISVFLFVSSATVSLEARGRHSERCDEEVEIEHIIIKKKKHGNPSHHDHESPSLHHHHRSPSHHHRIHKHLPDGYHSIRIIDKHYYYHDNVYYRKCRGGYEIVSTPRIRHLPRRSRKVIIDHSTYYIYDGIYFQFFDNYYEVCEPPKPRHRHRHKDPSIRFNIDIDIK